MLLLRALLPRDERKNLPLRPFNTGQLRRPDGTEIAYETFGRPDGPIVVLTHGLGMDHAVWHKVVHQFAPRYRLVTWDLPGMGRSIKGKDPFSMTNLADDLSAVIRAASEEAGGGKVIAVGHSLGGMLNLEMQREPERRELVRGLVQVHTTFTNPVRTMKGSRFYTAIEKPVLRPLLYASIVLSPLAKLMNLMSYLNGTAHLVTWKESFCGWPTFQELDFTARYVASSSPANQARISLALLNWDASDVLEMVEKPVLVVAADQDATCLPEASDFMRHRLPDADLFRLAPAKHLGMFQLHADFCRGLGDFCEHLSAGPTAGQATELMTAD